MFGLEHYVNRRLVVLRVNYQGDVVPEVIMGTQWKSGQPTVWALIHRGHMMMVVPPEESVGEQLIAGPDVFITPSLGFHDFWHQRHDQLRTAPGPVACRHCKPPKKAGSLEPEAYVRRQSCLAAAATCAVGGRQKPYSVTRATTKSGPSGLVLREYFAGHGVISQGWRDSGEVALEEVEVYANPHMKEGYKADHDLSDPKVQRRCLEEIANDGTNVEWIACPCTSYCDWGLQNGGTRTFQNPEGLPTAKEALGNTLSNFGAEAFRCALERGHFPIAESSGLSGRYPKQWNLPAWKQLLSRPDVDFLEVDMCAYGLCPKDATEDNQFYRHRTGLAFPRHPAFRAALFRLCPGLSSHHRHVPLQGSRDGTSVTRCTEAGVYAPAFVQAVVQALRDHVVVGGGPGFSPHSHLRAGGEQARSRSPRRSTEEDEDEESAAPTLPSMSPSLQPLREEPQMEEQLEAEGLSEGEAGEAEEEEAAGEADEGNAEDEAEGGAAEREAEGGATDEEHEHVEDEAEDGESRGEEGHSEADEEEGEEEEEETEAEMAIDEEQGDSWWVDRTRGFLWLHHNTSRVTLPVPDGPSFPFHGHQFRSERYTYCHSAIPGEETLSTAGEDDWRLNGAIPGPYARWTGTTVFVFNGHQTPQGFPWNEDPVPQHGPEPEPSPEGPRSDPEQEEGQGGPTTGQADAFQETGGSAEDRHAGSSNEEVHAGGSKWVNFEQEGFGPNVRDAAFNYVSTIDEIKDQEPDTWRKVVAAGDRLLTEACTVERAATALWIAREHLGRHNLQGVDDPMLDGALRPDLLAYLREIRQQGMPAKYQGQRERIQTTPHPRAKNNLSQVYRQLMKDVALHRVLVTDAAHPGLKHTVSSPFEAVPKMLPNRTLSTDVRVVHDQRRINAGTHKGLHPPAVQPMHQQIVRRILWLKTRYPGVDVVLAKKDVAGAFRLLWVDPKDVEIFGGEVPWMPCQMGSCQHEQKQPTDPKNVTMLYLVSSFGFSGSPGEWNVWGRATEEVHRAHRPQEARRDGAVHFDGKILVDDMVLVEPVLGLRPWISSEVYEGAVKKLLGDKAVNAIKDAEEGTFGPAQIVWGLSIDAKQEKMSLPEARILKGAYLLNGSAFNYGEKNLTLKDLQRFRGIATGWAVIVKGLKNELKAADLFLGGVNGNAFIRPSTTVDTDQKEELAWEDLWAFFEDCRCLCARSETWSEKFGGDIRELLPPMERLAIPGQLQLAAVFVSSDATLDVLGAIDWTNGLMCREELDTLKLWIRQVLESEGIAEDSKLAIHVGEMLSFVAFACKVGPRWVGKIVIYGGDNKVVYNWINGRKSGVRAGRLLVRVLNLIKMRFRCQILGGWWRTFHNEGADTITRLSQEEVMKLAARKGWEEVDIKESIHEALKDTERFGPCFLSWADEADRDERRRLQELRVFRAIHKAPTGLKELQIEEWTSGQRVVKDFEYFLHEGATGPKVVMGTIGPDPKGEKVRKFWEHLDQTEYEVSVLEGPRDVLWDEFQQQALKRGFSMAHVEYLTSELGEELVRRRRAYFAFRGQQSTEEIEKSLAKTVTPPSIGTKLRPATKENFWPCHYYEPAVGPQTEPMLPVIGAHVWMTQGGPRQNVYRMSGPCRWPLAAKEGAGVEELYVIDKAAPAGTVRRLTGQEIWQAQGRTKDEWEAFARLVGPEEAVREGCQATGRRTAMALIGAAGELAHLGEKKAGMCFDYEDYKSLGQILCWLRRWRRGDFPRAQPERKAGGSDTHPVWLWGETLWLDALIALEEDPDDRKAGGKTTRMKPNKAEKALGERVVCLQPGIHGDLNIQAQVEEWLEEHMDGDKAKSTRKIYQSAWERWCSWSRRQGWPTPYLSPKEDAVVNENKVLGYLGYLGWLGASVATLKQAIFAVKDAHKRAGYGDSTTKMHRVWIVINSLDRHSPKRPRRLGVTVSMLRWIGEHLENGSSSYGDLKVDCRMLQAALLTAWFFMLRAKEFSDSSGIDEEMIVRGDDIQLAIQGESADPDQAMGRWEATLQFRKTKADQEAFGTCRTMLESGAKHLCVVRALLALREVAPRRFGGPEGHLPLFRWSSGQVLKRLEVQNILQRAARAVGLPAERFQSHSLRIGGASALYQATGEIELVKRSGRWTSSAVHRYLHDSGDVFKGLAGKMAAVDQHVHYT